MEASRPRLRIVRLIARLNVGGPAIQAITLTRRMQELGYDTTLVRGSESEREGSMDGLAESLGVQPVMVRWLRRELGPPDLRAFVAIRRLLREVRPDLVHTHAAKAGTLGRLAVLALRRPRPVTIHTFHGHVLEGYFSGFKAQLFRAVERWLARKTTQLVAVSEEVRDDLVRLGIAPRERIAVVPLGFDLSRFERAEPDAATKRRQWRKSHRIDPDVSLVTLVARLVPIKRVDRFLEIAALVASRSGAHFLIVGDGELHDELMSSPLRTRLGDRLSVHGFTSRIEEIYFASDVVVLTSDNEGTPVSLIEAQAAAVPVVSTDVGGVRAVVRDGETGYVVAKEDVTGFARAVNELLEDRVRAERFGAAGRKHVTSTFTLEKLIDNLDRLYRTLLPEEAIAARP